MRPLVLSLFLAVAISAADAGRPGLFFREDFKETPAETPATQAHIANPNLILSLHGPGKAGVKKSHHDKPLDDPYYIWTGTCEGNCAADCSARPSDFGDQVVGHTFRHGRGSVRGCVPLLVFPLLRRLHACRAAGVGRVYDPRRPILPSSRCSSARPCPCRRRRRSW